MTIVYFVRHAHSPWLPNREATHPLSAAGHEAAANLAATLTDCPIDTVTPVPTLAPSRRSSQSPPTTTFPS